MRFAARRLWLAGAVAMVAAAISVPAIAMSRGGVRGGASAAKMKRSKALTKADVRKLIAAYVRSHRAQLRGPQGAPGPTTGLAAVISAAAIRIPRSQPAP